MLFWQFPTFWAINYSAIISRTHLVINSRLTSTITRNVTSHAQLRPNHWKRDFTTIVLHFVSKNKIAVSNLSFFWTVFLWEKCVFDEKKNAIGLTDGRQCVGHDIFFCIDEKIANSSSKFIGFHPFVKYIFDVREHSLAQKGKERCFYHPTPLLSHRLAWKI